MTIPFSLTGQVQVQRASDHTVLGHVVFGPTDFQAVRYQDDLVTEGLRAQHVEKSAVIHRCPTLDAAAAWVSTNPHLPDLSDLSMHGTPGMIGQTLWSEVHAGVRHSFFGIVRNGAGWTDRIHHVLEDLLHRGVFGLYIQTPLTGGTPEVHQVVVVDSTYDVLTLRMGRRCGSTGFGETARPSVVLACLERMVKRLREDHILPRTPTARTGHQVLLDREAGIGDAAAFAQAWDGRRADILARIEAGL